MLDLNKLIPPGSGWVLTNAFNINDHGEILAKAAPLRFTPNDDADLGHLALLIACKEDSSDCENSIERPESLPVWSKYSKARRNKDSMMVRFDED